MISHDFRGVSGRNFSILHDFNSKASIDFNFLFCVSSRPSIMAAPTLGLCRQALRLSHRTQWLSYRQLPVSRSFSSTQRRAEDGSKPPAADQAADGEDSTPYFNDTFYSSLYSSAKDSYLQSTPSQRRALEDFSTSAMDSLGPSSDFGKDMEALIEREILSSKSELGPEYFVKPEPTPRPKEDFSTMGEPEFDTAPDEKFQHDDISSLAHGQLDVHREMREHARLAAWEMPLLSRPSPLLLLVFSLHPTNTKDRTIPSLPRSLQIHPSTMALHILPRHPAPSSEQSRPILLPFLPPFISTTERETDQTLGSEIRPPHRHGEDGLRILPLPSAEQTVSRLAVRSPVISGERWEG